MCYLSVLYLCMIYNLYCFFCFVFIDRHIGNDNLQVEFEAWGEIVDSQISIDATGTAIGRLSYTKVEYAIRVKCRIL